MPEVNFSVINIDLTHHLLAPISPRISPDSKYKVKCNATNFSKQILRINSATDSDRYRCINNFENAGIYLRSASDVV